MVFPSLIIRCNLLQIIERRRSVREIADRSRREMARCCEFDRATAPRAIAAID
ncbi:hypothetical protein CKA32_002813 [Geitlerinema sp. FC II]|nr:hypothetical protein [Geitlerinema sp. CS-897]PPT10947.1 hypothetical protein CKA32_002813 [Geitlerinema sp. FC II]